MKKLLALLLLSALCLTPALADQAAVETIEVAGVPWDFSVYTAYDENGFATNYVKLRDVAWVLQMTYSKFSVAYDGSTVITTGAAYEPLGNEMQTLTTQDVTAKRYTAVLTVDGVGVPLDALLVTPADGGDGNFYYKLRDLAQAIGFTVGWSADRGVYIQSP